MESGLNQSTQKISAHPHVRSATYFTMIAAVMFAMTISMRGDTSAGYVVGQGDFTNKTMSVAKTAPAKIQSCAMPSHLPSQELS